METTPNADDGPEPTVRRITLGNTVFEGKNNVYLLESDSSLGLVDAGVATEQTRSELEDGLAAAGYDVADVDDVVLTHWHADHAGLAGELQAESGATVWAHSADAALVAGADDARADYREREERRFEEWQLPAAAREELRSFLDAHEDVQGAPAEVTTFDGGDRLRVGGVDLDVVHLPGHTAGLCGFSFAGPTDADADVDAGDEAFVGDAVLPKYTPNVGGADLRVDEPLARYVESLRRVIDADWSRVWPGHRDPIDAPADRARTILAHHRERTARVVDVLDRHGACDVWTVSAKLFGDLERIHILHGPGEAWAHLDHLSDHGVVERDGHDYRLVDEGADFDVDALFPDG